MEIKVFQIDVIDCKLIPINCLDDNAGVLHQKPNYSEKIKIKRLQSECYITGHTGAVNLLVLLVTWY